MVRKNTFNLHKKFKTWISRTLSQICPEKNSACHDGGEPKMKEPRAEGYET